MQNKNQKYGANAGDFQASPFLVDLKKIVEEKERLAKEEKKRFEFYEKAARFARKKIKWFKARDLTRVSESLISRKLATKAVKTRLPENSSVVILNEVPHQMRDGVKDIGLSKTYSLKMRKTTMALLAFYRSRVLGTGLWPQNDSFQAVWVERKLKFLYNKSHVFFNGILNFSEFLFNILKIGKRAGDKLGLTARFFVWPRAKNFQNLRSIAKFAAALIILIIPFKAYTYYASISNLKGKVLGASESAIGNLLKAGENAAGMDFSGANENFALAGRNFLTAQNELGKINSLLLNLAALSPNEEVKLAADAEHILAAGRAGSELGENLSAAADSLFNSQDAIAQKLDNFINAGKKSLINVDNLNNELFKINAAAVPKKYQDQFNELKNKGEFIAASLNEIISIAEKLKIFLGAAEDKRYLLVFQNNAEARASGGFIGSFAVADFRDGKIKNLEVPGGGSYDTEAGFYEKITAPEPLWLVNPLWHFWDANWWPDWPMTAKKLMWFYEKSNGPTVDGVISFTPDAVEKLLRIIGPIDMTEKYGIIISAENFWLATQELAEQKPDKTKEPKKIIGDLTQKIIEELPNRLDNKDKLAELIAAAEAALDEKHILFYFIDKELREKIERYGWDGKVKNTSWDYISVINTNIGGGKSDFKINQTINHSAKVQPDGSIIDTVEIKRVHTAVKGELFCGVRNVNWMRIYAPLNSALLEASGFEGPAENFFEKPESGWKDDSDLLAERNARLNEASGVKIYNEFGKTVFAGWTMTDPGEATAVKIRYRLPFKIGKENQNFIFLGNAIKKAAKILNPEQRILAPYALMAQKQAGADNVKIISKLILPENYKMIWHYPENAQTNSGWVIGDDLNVDKYWAGLMEYKENND